MKIIFRDMIKVDTLQIKNNSNTTTMTIEYDKDYGGSKSSISSSRSVLFTKLLLDSLVRIYGKVEVLGSEEVSVDIEFWEFYGFLLEG